MASSSSTRRTRFTTLPPSRSYLPPAQRYRACADLPCGEMNIFELIGRLPPSPWRVRPRRAILMRDLAEAPTRPVPMPKYDFHCTSCDVTFEAFRSFAQGTEGVVCPDDGAPA